MTKNEIVLQLLTYIHDNSIFQFLDLLNKPEVFQSIESSFTEDDFVQIKNSLAELMSSNRPSHFNTVFSYIGYNPSLEGLEGLNHLREILMRLHTFSANWFLFDVVLIELVLEASVWTTIYVTGTFVLLVVINVVMSILS